MRVQCCFCPDVVLETYAERQLHSDMHSRLGQNTVWAEV